MSDRKYDELYQEALSGRLNRRDVLRKGAALGLSIPVLAALLAACGDDGGATPTAAGSDSTSPAGGTTPQGDATPEDEATAEGETTPDMEGTPEGDETPDMGGTPETDETPDMGGTPEGDETPGMGSTPDAEGTPGGSGAVEWTREYEGTTIRWSTSLAESERQVFDDVILPDFEDKTGITVEFLQIEAADFIRQLEAQVAADAVEIDLFAIDNNSLAPLVAGGLIEDLSAYEDMIPAETLEALLPVLRFDDTLYFLPYRPNVQITYYNSTAFTDAGLEPPRTWEELMTVAQAFQEADGIGRLAVQGSPEGGGGPVGVTVTDFIWQAGGDPLVLNSPESIEAFTFLQELSPYLNPQTPTAKFDTMNTYIANDSVYIGQNWPFGVNVIVEEAGRDDVLAYSGWAGPAGEFHVLGGEVSGIPMGSPNRDAALVFAEYLMSIETQELLISELGWPAVREDAYGVVEGWQAPYFEAIRESMQNAMARPNVVYWGAVQGIMGDAFQQIVMDGASVEDTLNAAQDDIDAEANAASRRTARA